MLISISVLASCMLIIYIVMVLISPGKAIPLVDKDGNPITKSLSEKIMININGSKQGMFIKSIDTTNPVLLYLHGGMPDYFLTRRYPTGLENLFTVVWWEQRGSGLSYDAKNSGSLITPKQMIDDTKEITNYLRKRFNKEKIYIMGHSGGTFIGLQAVVEAPELYYAYLGVAQITNQLQSEKLAHDYMLEKFKEQGNKKWVKRLEQAPVSLTSGPSKNYITLRDAAMHKLGVGTMHRMNSVITGIFLPSLACKEYTLKEKINLWYGKSHSGVSVIWDTILSTDLSSKLIDIPIPVYFFHGVYDYTVSYDLARKYFNHINAPVKNFYTFEQSAHSPLFEEPAKMREIIERDIL